MLLSKYFTVYLILTDANYQCLRNDTCLSIRDLSDFEEYWDFKPSINKLNQRVLSRIHLTV